MSFGRIAAGVGGVAAILMTYFAGKESGKKEGRADGYKMAKAEYAAELSALHQKINAMSEEALKRDDFIICAYAVGISCARANGSLPVYKVEALEDLVFGIGKVQTRSKHVQDKVREMTLTPPNLRTVWSLIREKGFDKPHHKRMFTEIVDIMASIEEKPTKADVEFVEIWNKLAAA
ncbi:hypothetical protein E4185_14410 [Aeromonas media]|uniref:hypothetical protein n=1 Tax=Aeromonas TaxID=642 RepID=UPI00148B3130|nr:hypothetical protein [Aeromonas media]QJT27188.1 hypothetical protein E4185_14410 [Aeromonas media]